MDSRFLRIWYNETRKLGTVAFGREVKKLGNPLEHIAIIMDGNGRWARERGWVRAEGHRQGAKTVRKIVEESVRIGLKQLTLYCFSHENWKRPPEELQALMLLLENFMRSERPRMIQENIRLKVIGRREGIPDSALREMEESIRQTSENSGLTLCLAINYGGRQEIVDAAKRIAQKVAAGECMPDEVNEKLIDQHLYTAECPDPDLLIRTAGEMRLSNFLLWQLSYAELWVTEKYWPDFEIEDFHAAMEDFRRRERRYGAVLT